MTQRLTILIIFGVLTCLLAACMGSRGSSGTDVERQEPTGIAAAAAAQTTAGETKIAQAVAATLAASPQSEANPTAATQPNATSAQPAATDTPTAEATEPATAKDVPTPTAAGSPILSVKPDQTVVPTPTAVAIVLVEGGNDVALIRGTIVTYLHIRDQPTSPREFFPRKPVFVEQLSLQIKANVPSVGSWDGAGIKHVEMEVFDEDDTLIYLAKDNDAGYCLFGGNASQCNVERIAPHSSWPRTNTLYRNGHYVARFTVFPDDESFPRRSWSLEFEIRMPE